MLCSFSCFGLLGFYCPATLWPGPLVSCSVEDRGRLVSPYFVVNHNSYTFPSTCLFFLFLSALSLPLYLDLSALDQIFLVNYLYIMSFEKERVRFLEAIKCTCWVCLLLDDTRVQKLMKILTCDLVKQEAAALAATQVAFVLQSGQRRGLQFTVAPAHAVAPPQEPA